MRERLLFVLGLVVWLGIIVSGAIERQEESDKRTIVSTEHSEERRFERHSFDALFTGYIRSNSIQSTTARQQEKQQQTTFTSVFSRGFRLFYKQVLQCKYIQHLQIIPNFPSIDISYPFDVFW